MFVVVVVVVDVDDDIGPQLHWSSAAIGWTMDGLRALTLISCDRPSSVVSLSGSLFYADVYEAVTTALLTLVLTRLVEYDYTAYRTWARHLEGIELRIATRMMSNRYRVREIFVEAAIGSDKAVIYCLSCKPCH